MTADEAIENYRARYARFTTEALRDELRYCETRAADDAENQGHWRCLAGLAGDELRRRAPEAAILAELAEADDRLRSMWEGLTLAESAADELQDPAIAHGLAMLRWDLEAARRRVIALTTAIEAGATA